MIMNAALGALAVCAGTFVVSGVVGWVTADGQKFKPWLAASFYYSGLACVLMAIVVGAMWLLF